MKLKKYLIPLFLFIVLSILLSKGLNYLLVDDTKSYTRIMMHELYYPNENIDALFVGSSHCYRSVNPDVIDEKTGLYSFNGGTSSQRIDGSYEIIQQAIKNNDVKKVYLEMYFELQSKGKFNKSKNDINTYIISDYMNNNIERFDFIMNSMAEDYWINGFFPFHRNWDKIFNISYLKKLWIKKHTDCYQNYEYDFVKSEDEMYYGRGYVGSIKTFDIDKVNENTKKEVSTTALNNTDWERYLDKIVDLCNKKGIELVLFVAPEAEFTIFGMNNYQKYIDYMSDKAKKKGIKFYDFNLLKHEYFDASDNEILQDRHHLNHKGSQIFSSLFAKIISKELEYDDICYSSIKEKKNSVPSKVYGIGLNNDNDYNYQIVSVGNYEYYVTFKYDSGEEIIIQQYNTNKKLLLPKEEGTIIVDYRNLDNPNDNGKLIINK